MGQYTGSQRLVFLYRYLASGGIIFPADYARQNKLRRQTVYHQINLLKRMGFPIANTDRGEWKMGNWEDVDPDFTSCYLGGEHKTAAQHLVTLYQTLVEGGNISPTAYARKHHIERQTVYRQFDLLSQAGIPVVNTGEGWTLANYLENGYE